MSPSISKDLSEPWAPIHVTEWLPGETLFSLASRHHHISGNILAAQTSLQLFGHSRQGLSHDFPARVSHFVKQTHGLLGNQKQIILERTILPFYFPFRHPRSAANAIAAAQIGDQGKLKACLGILASRFGAAHPLKACPICMAEDQKKYQVSYWHREHQWPGAWVCQKHSVLLNYALYKVNGKGRFQWCLPCDTDFGKAISTTDFEIARLTMVRLTECACALGNLPSSFNFDPEVLALTYQQRLMEIGCLTAKGRIISGALENSLALVCTPLSRLYSFKSLEGKETSLLSQFTRLVREPRGTPHPIKHFVLILTLFENWHSFISKYDYYKNRNNHVESVICTGPFTKTKDASQNTQKISLIDAVKDGMSATTAAALHGVAVSTAMAWLAEFGIITPRRPKLLVPSVRAQVIELLKKGTSKENASAVANVSIQTITLLLRTEPGLRSAWNETKFSHAQRSARSAWSRTAHELGSTTAKQLRQLQPSIFAWLYRNDRAWLQEFSTELSKAPRSNNSTIRWDERDRDLSQAVRIAAYAIHRTQPNQKIRLAALCDEIPQLKSRLSNLNQLPLTKSAIAEATKSRRKIRSNFSTFDDL